MTDIRFTNYCTLMIVYRHFKGVLETGVPNA